MASVIGVLALAAGAFVLEMPGLMRKKLTREIVVFLILLLIASAVYIALALGVELPNPLQLLKIGS